MTDAPLLNVVELSVSELSNALKRVIEEGFDHVRVRGELGKVSYHSNGHIYFDLKDDRSSIAGVIWRSAAPRIKLKLEAGLEVVATGRITTYQARSQYQLVVETLEPAGLGALMALLEERKKKLAAEGLFDEARKQLLPFLPDVIGVITSPTGAVIRDILHRLSDRFPRHVVVWPVRVQGDTSAAEVANAIRGFNALADGGRIRKPHLIIVARGGGSLEDLWSFNEEIVVRAAADSLIPLISAVGHETDITLIDFASDRRAPTPTAAAEMAVPVRSELLGQVAALGARQLSCWQRGLDQRRKELRALSRALPTAERLFEARRQRLDSLSERLPQALRTNAHAHERRYARIAAQLSPQTLRAHLRVERSRLRVAAERSVTGFRSFVERRRERFTVLAFEQRAGAGFARYFARLDERVERAERLLEAYSYQSVLKRGFALVRNDKGAPLRSAAAVSAGMRLDLEFADGRVGAVAEGAGVPKPPKPPRRRRGGGSDEGQGNLFG
jgi:exodeoxyribonuclease VII large subunit